MPTTLEEGKPIRPRLPVLALHARQVHAPSINSRRGASLEAFYCKSIVFKYLRKLYRGAFAGPPGGNLRAEAHVDPATEEGAGGHDDRLGLEPTAIRRGHSADTSADDLQLRDGALNHVQSSLALEQAAHRPAVESPVALGPRRPHRRALRAVQHPELDPGEIGGPAHDPAKRVDFARNGALGDPADGGIARHLPDGLEVLGEEQSAGSGARGDGSRLAPGVSTADHDHIVARIHEAVNLTTSPPPEASQAGGSAQRWRISATGIRRPSRRLPRERSPRWWGRWR